jgi:transposase
LRKQINGLATMAQGEMELDPFSGSLYLFCNQSLMLVKALYWDRNGFCLWQTI